jgi:hypothetical protein
MRTPKCLAPLPACHVPPPELNPIDAQALFPEPPPPAEASGASPPLLEAVEEA